MDSKGERGEDREEMGQDRSMCPAAMGGMNRIRKEERRGERREERGEKKGKKGGERNEGREGGSEEKRGKRRE